MPLDNLARWDRRRRPTSAMSAIENTFSLIQNKLHSSDSTIGISADELLIAAAASDRMLPRWGTWSFKYGYQHPLVAGQCSYRLAPLMLLAKQG
jgi:hypothetical protein